MRTSADTREIERALKLAVTILDVALAAYVAWWVLPEATKEVLRRPFTLARTAAADRRAARSRQLRADFEIYMFRKRLEEYNRDESRSISQLFGPRSMAPDSSPRAEHMGETEDR